MPYHRSSQGAGCRNPNQTSHQQYQQQGTFNHTRRPEPPRYHRPRYGTTVELSQMIDEHLALWHLSGASNDRPASKGTVIVDWDGSGSPAISYREKATVTEEVCVPRIAPASLDRRASRLEKADNVKQDRRNAAMYTQKPLPSLPTDERVSKQTKRKPLIVGTSYPFPRHDPVVSEARISSRRHAQHFLAPPSVQPPAHPQHAQYTTGDGFTAEYHPSRSSKALDSHRCPYINGYDEMTHLAYDYDGRIFHVHRSPSGSLTAPRGSTHSDYYSIDADKYDAQALLRVEDEELPSLSAEQGRKRNSVVGFVEKVLFKLDRLCLTEKLICDKKVARKGGTWQEAGYTT